MITELQHAMRKRAYSDRALVLRMVEDSAVLQIIAENIFDKAESPIERILFIELVLTLHSMGSFGQLGVEMQPTIIFDDGVEQKRIRPDALLRTANRMIVVECDGYNYHGDEKMFISDRARDRLLVRVGYTPIRFASAEIFNHPRNCAWELLELMPEVTCGRS